MEKKGNKESRKEYQCILDTCKGWVATELIMLTFSYSLLLHPLPLIFSETSKVQVLKHIPRDWWWKGKHPGHVGLPFYFSNMHSSSPFLFSISVHLTLIFCRSCSIQFLNFWNVKQSFLSVLSSSACLIHSLCSSHWSKVQKPFSFINYCFWVILSPMNDFWA